MRQAVLSFLGFRSPDGAASETDIMKRSNHASCDVDVELATTNPFNAAQECLCHSTIDIYFGGPN